MDSVLTCLSHSRCRRSFGSTWRVPAFQLRALLRLIHAADEMHELNEFASSVRQTSDSFTRCESETERLCYCGSLIKVKLLGGVAPLPRLLPLISCEIVNESDEVVNICIVASLLEPALLITQLILNHSHDVPWTLHLRTSSWQHMLL